MLASFEVAECIEKGTLILGNHKLTMELDANNITGENWDANNAGED
jgi:hypothetical protein